MPDPLPPLTVVVGEEDLLIGRAVQAVVGAARAVDPQADVRDLNAGELQRGDLPQLLSPSLFAERRVLVLRAAQELSDEVAAELTAYVAEPLPEISVVVCHGGTKGKALLSALQAAGAARVDAPKMTKVQDRRDFLRAELRSGGRTVSEAAISLLLDAVGGDLRELWSAATQLLADTEGPIDEEVVGRYHRGRADLKGFAIAERAVDGDLAGALELTRYGQASGLAPVLVTSALASSLRSVAFVASARNEPAQQVAARLGMPAWRVDRTRRQAAAWGPEGLSTALREVAESDAQVKGAAADEQYAVERVLLAVVRARESGR